LWRVEEVVEEKKRCRICGDEGAFRGKEIVIKMVLLEGKISSGRDL